MPWFHEGLYTSGKRLKQSTGSDFVDLSLLRYSLYCLVLCAWSFCLSGNSVLLHIRLHFDNCGRK